MKLHFLPNRLQSKPPESLPIFFEKTRLPRPDSSFVLAALLNGIRISGISSLPWTKDQHLWQARVEFLRRMTHSEPGWPDMQEDTLLTTLETWLAPYLTNISSLAPTHLTVPTESRII